jgi:hypothetical protein
MVLPKVQVISQIEIDFDEILNSIAQLETTELEMFVEKVIALQARRRAASLSKTEAELFQKINQGVSSEVRRRYIELNDKLHDETIAPEEHQELLTLIDQIELADAERMRHLVELAQLRNVPVDRLIDQLGIRRRVYA